MELNVHDLAPLDVSALCTTCGHAHQLNFYVRIFAYKYCDMVAIHFGGHAVLPLVPTLVKGL